ncbi:MAG: three-Cys-motif partner protein TcmP, partial [SAR324 cluster bacterium]|nr:three-Cys-motif partner protein TcmP [SAR324 cluster bacterium]
MNSPTEHEFGGDWTEDKLLRVSKYLSAYTTIMRRFNFQYAYIDAFAGTGYITLKDEEDANELLLPEFAEPETQSFIDGSAKIALKVEH